MNRQVATGFLAITLAALSLASGTAHAVDDAAKSRAAVHFERGVALYDEGSLDAALVEFERAYELVPNYRVLYNLGQVQAERHEYTAAIDIFERYLADGAGRIASTRRDEVSADLELLKQRIAYLHVETNVEGAALFVDEVAMGTLPLAEPFVAINPGVANVRVEKEGYLTASERLKVASGERPRLRLSLTPLPVGPASERAATRANYTPAWVMTGSVLALGGATLAVGFMANDADRTLDTELDRVDNDRRIASARSRLRTYSAMTDVFLGASVVALGLAVYLWVAPPERDVGESEAVAGADVRVLPTADGLQLVGRF